MTEPWQGMVGYTGGGVCASRNITKGGAEENAVEEWSKLLARQANMARWCCVLETLANWRLEGGKWTFELTITGLSNIVS